MNKSELIEAVQKTLDSTRADAERSVDAVIGALEHGIIKKGGVSLVGFGNFTVNKRAARDGINPATGEKIKIKASKGVKFKAGTALKKAVNK
jgi:nucleoid DNA-binding protein